MKKYEILPSSTGATAGFLPTINRYDSTKMPIHLTMRCFVLGPDHPATSPHRSPQRCLTSWVSDSRRLIFSLRCKPTVNQQSPRKAVRVLGSSAQALRGSSAHAPLPGVICTHTTFFWCPLLPATRELGGAWDYTLGLGKMFQVFFGAGTRGLGDLELFRRGHGKKKNKITPMSPNIAPATEK